MLVRLAVCAFAACVLAACYEPPHPACGFACGTQGECPSGYTCNLDDGACHADDAVVEACPPGTPFVPPPPPLALLTWYPDDERDEPVSSPTVLLELNNPILPPPMGSIALTTADGAPFPVIVELPDPMHVYVYPAGELVPGERYRVDVTSAIRDVYGSSLRPQHWFFTVYRDLTGPMIIGRAPARDELNASVEAQVQLTFSEPVQDVSSTTVEVSRAGMPVPFTTDFVAGNQAVQLVMDTQFAPNTTYQVHATPGITDLFGNALADETWSFTTGADDVPPRIRAITPIGTLAIPRDSIFTVTFDEPVVDVSAASVALTDATSTVVPATVTYDAPTRTATVAPLAPLAPLTTHTLKLGAPIADAYGNTLTPFETKFTTGTLP